MNGGTVGSTFSVILSLLTIVLLVGAIIYAYYYIKKNILTKSLGSINEMKVGNMLVNENEISIGNTKIKDNNIKIGDTIVNNNEIIVGKTNIKNNEINIGDTKIKNNNMNIGEINIGNINIKDDQIIIGDTSIKDGEIIVGKTSIKKDEINIDNKITLKLSDNLIKISTPTNYLFLDKLGNLGLNDKNDKKIYYLSNEGTISGNMLTSENSACGTVYFGCKNNTPSIWT